MQFLRVCLFLAFCLVALTQGKYSISVEPSARLEVAGREIKEGDVVPVGTEFSFKVSLSEDGEKLTKGKFVLLFQVLDSSNSVVHKQTLNGAQNAGALEFKYELKNGNIPAGKLKFDFSVQGTDASTSVVYVFNVPMIATKIVVSSRTLKLGDSVKFSMEPASFPDLRSVQTYDASFRANRRFFLDLSSLAGHLVHSVAGTADNSGSYVFDFKIPNSLAVIGTNVISFRYVGADQASVPLSNYDSVLSELYDDPKSQNVTVEAELSIGGLKEAPKDTDFYYGNQIRYRFNIKDALSSKNVVATGYSAVLLSLAHTEGGSTFTNIQVPAKQEGEEFVISWEINPNIITGKSVLELVAQDTDGNKIPLLLNNKPASFEVNIGGHIEHTSKTHSAVSSFFQRTSLLVEFSLYCQGKLLNGAKLTASFQYGGKEVATVPATQDGNGQYSVTLLADTAFVPQGTYDVLVFRDIDRQRAVEAAEAKRRKLEKDRRLKGEDASVDVATEDVTPFFTVKLEHQPSGDKLPVKPELIATVIFAAFFSYLFFKSS